LNTDIIKGLLGEKLPYKQQQRAFGFGDIRIGQSLELNEDIFGLSFVMSLKECIILENFDIIEGKLISSDDKKEEQVQELTP